MRRVFAAAVIAVSTAPLLTGGANAMTGARGIEAYAAAAQLGAVENVACWWSRRWGRMVCSPVAPPPVAFAPPVIAPPVVVAPRVVAPGFYYRPYRVYRRW